MSNSFLSTSLTQPEQDMLAWYRLGPDPYLSSYHPIAALPIPYNPPLADDTPAASIDMPIAA
jgi:hypothetical protein